jgi:hypothetical protein
MVCSPYAGDRPEPRVSQFAVTERPKAVCDAGTPIWSVILFSNVEFPCAKRSAPGNGFLDSVNTPFFSV